MDYSLNEIEKTKREMRARCAAYRASLSDDEYRELCLRVIDRTWTLGLVQEAQTVHIYWPLVHRREIDTRGLIARLRRANKHVVLPVVMEFSSVSGNRPRMEHRLWEPDTALRPNRWGVHEPQGLTTVPLEAIDVVIVPAFAAGRNGHRVGHGFGFYDEFLSGTPAPTIGLVYSTCFVDRVPHEQHDVPLDVVITEEEVWKRQRS